MPVNSASDLDAAKCNGRSRVYQQDGLTALPCSTLTRLLLVGTVVIGNGTQPAGTARRQAREMGRDAFRKLKFSICSVNGLPTRCSANRLNSRKIT